jgi:S-methylmethionine-dependent homocysteine/selenocysteine methylase
MTSAEERRELGDRALEMIARPGASLEGFGAQLSFYFRALAWAPRTVRRYKKEMGRLLTEVCFGTGALAVIGCAGAYGASMSNHYNARPRAAEVMVVDGKPRLVRARESLADLWRGEELE